YTDDAFKDIKTIPYKTAGLTHANLLEELNQMQRKEHKGNTLYYSKNFTDQEATALFDYLVSSGFFSTEGNNDSILEKNGNSFHFKFPVKASFANEEGFQKVDDFAKELKRDLYADVSIQFEVLDDDMASLKTF